MFGALRPKELQSDNRVVAWLVTLRGVYAIHQSARRVAGDVCELPLVLGGPLPLVARQLVEGRSTWFLSSWKALSVRLESLTYVPTHAGTGVFDHLAASRRAVLCVLYVLFVLLEPTFH